MRKENIIETTSVRRLSITDDHKRVADLIYHTDKYIFPYLFDGNIELAEKVFVRMIKRNTIYNYRNVYVADCNGEVLGIVVLMATPIKLDRQEMITSFLEAGAVVNEKFKRVFDEYYKLLEDEPPDIYIANVCVDSRYRGIGIASKMLNAILRDDKVYHLETVKSNEPALKLYKDLGFEIDCEYPGFTEVPCYRMSKKVK